MKPLVIIRSGNTWPQVATNFGEFETQFLNRFSIKPENAIVIKAQENPTFPKSENISGVIISGAHENLTDNLSWMSIMEKWIKKIHLQNIPMMGVCFGHQIIGKALGGNVAFNPNGDEYGLLPIQMHTKTAVFNIELPDLFYAYATHSQSIVELPKGAKSLAKSELEPSHIVHFGNKTWGFQFHPEFTYKLTHNYIKDMKTAQSLGVIDQQNEAENIGQKILNSFLSYCK